MGELPKGGKPTGSTNCMPLDRNIDNGDLRQILVGTTDLGLFFKRNQEFGLIKYADAGYLSDP
jgi:hypothetical protein